MALTDIRDIAVGWERTLELWNSCPPNWNYSKATKQRSAKSLPSSPETGRLAGTIIDQMICGHQTLAYRAITKNSYSWNSRYLVPALTRDCQQKWQHLLASILRGNLRKWSSSRMKHRLCLLCESSRVVERRKRRSVAINSESVMPWKCTPGHGTPEYMGL